MLHICDFWSNSSGCFPGIRNHLSFPDNLTILRRLTVTASILTFHYGIHTTPQIAFCVFFCREACYLFSDYSHGQSSTSTAGKKPLPPYAMPCGRVFPFSPCCYLSSSFLYSQNKMVGTWPECLEENIKSLPRPRAKLGIPQCVETTENIHLLVLQE